MRSTKFISTLNSNLLLNSLCMYRISLYIFLLICVGMISSCGASRRMAYLQDLNDTSRIQSVRAAALDPIKLQSGDQIQVTVSSIVPEASQLFSMMGAAVTSGTTTQLVQNAYTLSPTGIVTVPVIGDVNLNGLTIEESKAKIQEQIIPYLKDAIVNVSLMNFRVTVMGEVTRPMTLQVAGERVNVLEAIGMAGDITVYGKRYNIKVIRKMDDKIEVAHINLNNSKSFRSPFFYLKQNDIVYVEPVKRKAINADTYLGILPTILSFASLIVLTLRYTTR